MDILAKHVFSKCPTLKDKIRRNVDHRSKVHYMIRCESSEENYQLIEDLFHRAGLLLANLHYERGCYAVELTCHKATPWILEQFNLSAQISTDRSACLNIAHLSAGEASLQLLRCLVISQHVQKMLSRLLGCQSQVLQTDDSLDHIINQCCQSSLPLPFSPSNQASHTLHRLLDCCSHVHPAEAGCWDIVFPSKTRLHGAVVDRYRLTKDSVLYSQLSYLLHSKSTGSCVDMYHIIPASQAYQHSILLQLLDILRPDHQITHHTVLVAGVKIQSPSAGSPLIGYVSNRRNYIIRASEEKHGLAVHESSFWRERIDVLTLTSIKFEMLSKQAHQPLTLTSESSDARMGPFVMYNVSRLSTLFSNYQTGVDKGVYPALPVQQDVDFSLLKTEDEWLLVFHHINAYPVLRSTVVQELEVEGEVSSRALSQVVRFMYSLSRDFSTYYNRTHILGENKDHLIPTMMSRLWLVRTANEILNEGLELIGAEAFDSM